MIRLMELLQPEEIRIRDLGRLIKEIWRFMADPWFYNSYRLFPFLPTQSTLPPPYQLISELEVLQQQLTVTF